MKYALLAGPPPRVAVVFGDEEILIDLGAALSAVGDTGEIPANPFDAAVMNETLRPRFESAVAILMETGGLDAVSLPPFAARLAPVPNPRRLLCIGRNYADHAKELGNAVPDEPVVFLKSSSCVVGPDAAIIAPGWVGRVDFEGELLVVLGGGGKNVAEQDAMELVLGYTCFNDVTAREKSKTLQGKGHPWFLAKSMDTFGPMGPHLVTKDELPDPGALSIALTQNGETRQDGSTSSMIHRVAALIAFVSKWTTLAPGDCIATGTPSGIAPIAPGDVLELTIEGIGTLRSAVVGE